MCALAIAGERRACSSITYGKKKQQRVQQVIEVIMLYMCACTLIAKESQRDRSLGSMRDRVYHACPGDNDGKGVS